MAPVSPADGQSSSDFARSPALSRVGLFDAENYSFVFVSEYGAPFTVFGLVARARIAAQIGFPIHPPAPQGAVGCS
jgi:hypothetical protein